MKEECKKVYHFTTDAAWECMNKGVDIWLYDASKHEHVDGMQVRGLWPMQRFLPDEYAVGLPAKAGDPVIEALLEPCPSGWTNNPEFPGYWNRLMRNILTVYSQYFNGFTIVIPTKEQGLASPYAARSSSNTVVL